jgi:transcriptional regulator with XRE-family HTH domain
MRTIRKTPKEYKLKIGENARKWRDLRGMKQKDLADKMFLSESALSNIENDITVPNIHQVEDLADALNIDFVHLFCDPQEHYIRATSKTGVAYAEQPALSKEAISVFLDRIDRKDVQMQMFMKEIVTNITSLLKS